VTSDPYATTSSDPYGARAMQSAVDKLVDAMATKLKAEVLGIPGPDPLRIEVVAEDKEGLDVRVEVTLPLGVSRQAMGHVVSITTSLLDALIPAGKTATEIVEQQDQQQDQPVDHPV